MTMAIEAGGQVGEGSKVFLIAPAYKNRCVKSRVFEAGVEGVFLKPRLSEERDTGEVLNSTF